MGVGHGIGLAVLDCQEHIKDDRSIALYMQDRFLTRDSSLTMEHFNRVFTEDLAKVDFKTVQTENPVRRICVQSGRSSHLPIHVQEDSTQQINSLDPDILSDLELRYFLEYDYREALLHASNWAWGLNG